MEARNGKNIRLPYTLIPYIPPEIDLSDLGDNLCLLSDEMLQRMDEYLSVKVDRRYSKKELQQKFSPDLKYSIVVHAGEKYILYKGRKRHGLAGVGDFGVVKYLQHVKSKQWHAVKSISQIHTNFDHVVRLYQPAFMKTLSVTEHALLQKFKVAQGSLGERMSASKGLQYYIIMHSAPGTDLFDYIEERRSTLHPQHFIALLIKICEIVNQLHQSGFIHRDVKQENMRFDLASGELTLLDFGLAEAIPADGVLCDQSIYGTKEKRAPEIFEGCYSVKTDTFAVGATLADLLGILNCKMGEYDLARLHPREMVDKQSDMTLFDKATYLRLYDVCAAMMRLRPEDRLDLSSAVSELMLIQKEMPCGNLSVNVLDLAIYAELLAEQKEHIKRALAIYCHEVIITVPRGFQITCETVRFIRSLEAAGLKVMDKIFYLNEPDKIISELKSEEPNVQRVHFMMSDIFPQRASSQFFKPDKQAVTTKPAEAPKNKCVMM